jgi:hypothetical protein
MASRVHSYWQLEHLKGLGFLYSKKVTQTLRSSPNELPLTLNHPERSFMWSFSPRAAMVSPHTTRTTAFLQSTCNYHIVVPAHDAELASIPKARASFEINSTLILYYQSIVARHTIYHCDNLLHIMTWCHLMKNGLQKPLLVYLLVTDTGGTCTWTAPGKQTTPPQHDTKHQPSIFEGGKKCPTILFTGRFVG